jgi:hypothetical protein
VLCCAAFAVVRRRRQCRATARRRRGRPTVRACRRSCATRPAARRPIRRAHTRTRARARAHKCARGSPAQDDPELWNVNGTELDMNAKYKVPPPASAVGHRRRPSLSSRPFTFAHRRRPSPTAHRDPPRRPLGRTGRGWARSGEYARAGGRAALVPPDARAEGRRRRHTHTRARANTRQDRRKTPCQIRKARNEICDVCCYGPQCVYCLGSRPFICPFVPTGLVLL